VVITYYTIEFTISGYYNQADNARLRKESGNLSPSYEKKV